MVLTLEQIRRFLGRPLQDPYGRAYGKIVGISANLKDEVTAVGVEVGNGEFVQSPGDRLSISGDNLLLTECPEAIISRRPYARHRYAERSSLAIIPSAGGGLRLYV